MRNSIVIISIGLAVTFPAFADEEGKKIENTSNYEQFTECTAVTSWLLKGRNIDEIDGTRRIKIPKGWKVVGTNTIDRDPVFFICR